MNSVPFFLNERSYPIQGDRAVVDRVVLTFLKALYRAKSHASDLSVRLASEAPLSSLILTDDSQTLASLTGVMDTEWWRFIRLLDQYSPFPAMPRSVSSGLHAVNDITSLAEVCAAENCAFVASFPSSARYCESRLTITLCDCVTGGHGHGHERESYAMNVSEEGHADEWAEQIRYFGQSFAGSSAVFNNGHITLRMYFNDHDPPHVHVFSVRSGSLCIAKVRFDTSLPEVLEAATEFRSVRADVLELISRSRGPLMIGWALCREGKHPIVIEQV